MHSSSMRWRIKAWISGTMSRLRPCPPAWRERSPSYCGLGSSPWGVGLHMSSPRVQKGADKIKPAVAPSMRLAFLATVYLLLVSVPLWAATGGSISGVVADQSGALIPGATLKLVNTAQRTIYQAVSDKQGLYSFPNLPVGHYDLSVQANGFTPQRKTDLTVDTASAIRADISLAVGSQSDTVTVTSEAGAQVETTATNLGEVVSGSQMTALPLNGRSYTDLLAIQPGVAPITTLLPSSVIMAGVPGR